MPNNCLVETTVDSTFDITKKKLRRANLIKKLTLISSELTHYIADERIEKERLILKSKTLLERQTFLKQLKFTKNEEERINGTFKFKSEALPERSTPVQEAIHDLILLNAKEVSEPTSPIPEITGALTFMVTSEYGHQRGFISKTPQDLSTAEGTLSEARERSRSDDSLRASRPHTDGPRLTRSSSISCLRFYESYRRNSPLEFPKVDVRSLRGLFS